MVVVLSVLVAIVATVAMGLNKGCVMPVEMCGMFPGCEVRDPCECVLPGGCEGCVARNYCASAAD